MTMFDRLVKEAQYAQNSFSTELLYQVHGEAMIAYELKAITADESRVLNDMTVRFMNTDKGYIAHKNKEYFDLVRKG